MFEHPTVSFSSWTQWDDRAIKEQPFLGVYLWAHFHHRPDAMPAPSESSVPRELIYVGETKDLNSRLLGGNGTRHHRLEHYRDIYPADKNLHYLYVSVFPVECYVDTPRCRALRAYTRYIEDLMYWKYVETFGSRAALDYKKKPNRWAPAECCRDKVRRGGRTRG